VLTKSSSWLLLVPHLCICLILFWLSILWFFLTIESNLKIAVGRFAFHIRFQRLFLATCLLQFNRGFQKVYFWSEELQKNFERAYRTFKEKKRCSHGNSLFTADRQLPCWRRCYCSKSRLAKRALSSIRHIACHSVADLVVTSLQIPFVGHH